MSHGWTNYETYCVALWVGNERESYEYWRDVTASAYRESSEGGALTRKENAARTIADRLKDEIESGAADLMEQAGQSSSIYADLLRAAISETNWDEIAANWLDDLDTDEIDAEEAADAE